MKVFVAPDEIKKFKRRVLKSYPNEHMELLWGKEVSKNEFHVFFFDNQFPYIGTPRTCCYDNNEIDLSAQWAEEAGYMLLGSIHSHPNCNDTAPSEWDYDEALKQGEKLFGIAQVIKSPKGRRKVVIRFWGPLEKVEPLHF